jgi:hypothetical protein
MLREVGFHSVEVLEILDDPFNLHFFCRKKAEMESTRPFPVGA